MGLWIVAHDKGQRKFVRIVGTAIDFVVVIKRDNDLIGSLAGAFDDSASAVRGGSALTELFRTGLKYNVNKIIETYINRGVSK